MDHILGSTPTPQLLRGLTLLLTCLATNFLTEPLLADSTTESWLRGADKELEICLRGELFTVDGKPALDAKVSININAQGRKIHLEPEVKGHRFEAWIPVNQYKLFSLSLQASSAKDGHLAFLKIDVYELRQAALDGVKLTLQRPARNVRVKVTYEGKPVANATVKTELGYSLEMRASTDTQGIAQFGLLPNQKLSRFTAWTEDFRLGGYSFYRKPTRDPSADEHEVELSKCRDQKMLFVDETETPVADVECKIQIATPSPNYNYLGSNEHSALTSDAAGEVLYRWFPDWEEHHFSVELDSDKWVLDGKHEVREETVVFKLKKRLQRKKVRGQVALATGDAGGFQVNLSSFQGERKKQSDWTNTFTNADGSFWVDILPDATYCAYMLDTQWVGEIIDLIPYQSAPEQITPVELSVVEGVEVEVFVTSGPQKKPYPNLTVIFSRKHDFQWREDGEIQYGEGGSGWEATTDASGRATTRTTPGKLEVYTHTPEWREEVKVDVSANETTTITLHREIDEKRKATGFLVLDDEADEIDLQGAEIQVGSIDDNNFYEQTLTTNRYGAFSFETFSTNIGIFGYTNDGKFAGLTVTEDLDAPIEVLLQPTQIYRGQLLGEGDQPLINHEVRAVISVAGVFDMTKNFSNSFTAKRFKTKTDAEGNYEFHNLPVEMKISLYAEGIATGENRRRLEKIFLKVDETRPRMINRLKNDSTRNNKISLVERFEQRRRDCEVMGYQLLVITSNKTPNVTRFIDKHFLDRRTNDAIYSCMQLVISRSPDELTATEADFLAENNWEIPTSNHISAYAVDAFGNETGRIEVDPVDTEAPALVAQFIQKHAPTRSDAKKKWQEAFAEAKKSDRRVWVRISQRYCGPCFKLARWLDDQQQLLKNDYVMLKIDDVHDLNGQEIAQRLTLGKQFGIPFHAIFDQDEKLLITSEGSLGNIGSLSGTEGAIHLRKMFLETRQNLTNDEVEQLVESLGN